MMLYNKLPQRNTNNAAEILHAWQSKTTDIFSHEQLAAPILCRSCSVKRAFYHCLLAAEEDTSPAPNIK